MQAYDGLRDSPRLADLANREAERIRQEQLEQANGTAETVVRFRLPSHPDLELVRLHSEIDGKPTDRTTRLELRKGCHTVSFVAKFKGHGNEERYTYEVKSRHVFDVQGPKSVTINVTATDEPAASGKRLAVHYDETDQDPP